MLLAGGGDGVDEGGQASEPEPESVEGRGSEGAAARNHR
jgi:hypothetical protein